jgi:hypothetical protein
VVTVHGTRPEVERHKTPTPRSVPSRIGNGLKTGAMTAWKGVVGLTGWLLNTDDDIPSERERARKAEDRQN